MGNKRQFRIWRGDETGGDLQDYTVEVNEGEVVLDVIHRLQATDAPDLACRWNCKAGKCGSCSMEINGKPRLSCMTRMSTFEEAETVTVTPLRTFPVIRDLVTDVSFNYEKAREMPAFAPPADVAPGDYRMQQVDVERSQEFRKCIECFLCQTVCHVIRDHEENKQAFAGPRFFIRAAELDMHPLDAKTDRKDYAQAEQGLGFCNITKCCTEVCPEHIKITDNGIIPMKERVVDRRYDPLVWLGSKIFRRGDTPQSTAGSAGKESAVHSGARQSGVHSHAGGSHDPLAEVQAQQGVNWHREVPHPTAPAVDATGRLPLTELTFDRAAAPSPFGDDVTFPLPPEHLNFAHPSQDEKH
ncbi:succinate dehydrogenase/fumarate reductase iron-sulfur subunit [Micromonospora sp. CPCC 206171]|uniref:succinate dehydrogenase/fumarate reductase iron-sulfur subunit n=1 Tax=Micromonospora sp. CPCC 206171 TaxID=3122405 RepID=UPI002FF32FA7